VVLLVTIILLASSFLAEPLRKFAQQQASHRLPDYEVTIGTLRLHPFRLAIDFGDVVVQQRANPDPPLAKIPNLNADLRLLPLFTGAVALDLEIDEPQFAATSQQVDALLHAPVKKEATQQAVAWQDTLRDMRRIGVSLSLRDGQVRYQPEPKVDPIQLDHVDITAANVTNRPSENDSLPSTLQVHARVSDQSTIALDSRADFLAKPSPRIEGDVKVERLSLPHLAPITKKYNIQIQEGALDMAGHIEHVGQTTVMDIKDLVVEGAHVDYVHRPDTKHQEVQAAQKGAQTVKKAHEDPSMIVKVSHGKIVRSDIGFINKAASPDYRVFFSDMSLELENFSNRPEEGMGEMKLTGKFMGSGPTVVTGSFRPEKPNPDFRLQVRIVKTQVQALNRLLEAHGRIDTTKGTFALFSEMAVKHNHIDGYVKPFLKDVEVYNPEQDKDKAAAQKLYEAVAGGVLKLFKSRSTEQAATKADISGTVDNPKESTWQVVEQLVENAFFKAILPGFEHSPKA
jgi:hypothetical protein